MTAEERRLLYVAATRAKDRLFLVDGGKGPGSTLRDALVEGTSGRRRRGGPLLRHRAPGGAAAAGGFRAEGGRQAGNWLRVEVTSALREEAPRPPAPLAGPAIAWAQAGEEAEPVPSRPRRHPGRSPSRNCTPVCGEAVRGEGPPRPRGVPACDRPVAAAGGRSRDLGRGGGATVERDRRRRALLFPVPGASLSRVVGTELPLLRVRGGTASEERADLVVRPPERPGEMRVIDYKTGERDRRSRRVISSSCGSTADILSEAWRVPVRGDPVVRGIRRVDRSELKTQGSGRRRSPEVTSSRLPLLLPERSLMFLSARPPMARSDRPRRRYVVGVKSQSFQVAGFGLPALVQPMLHGDHRGQLLLRRERAVPNSSV